MTVSIAAVSGHTYWWIALAIGLTAAVVVAILLILLLRAIGSIEKSVDGLLAVAGKVGSNTAHIPQLQATAPVLAEIVDEAVVQDGYMNALTDGFGDAAGAAPPPPDLASEPDDAAAIESGAPAGDLAAGDPAAGDPAAGDPAAGDPAAGDLAAGERRPA